MNIGITGKAGSGKSSIISMLCQKYDMYIINCDNVAKDIIKEINFKINVNANGFLDENEQERIRKDFHPLVWERVLNKIVHLRQNKMINNIIIETALPSDIFFKICNITFLIISNNSFYRLKYDRLYNDEKITNIINSQNNYEKFYNKCDYVIDNNYEIDIAFQKIVNILEQRL